MYIKRDDLKGWAFDRETLRPTDYHQEQRRRAREEARTTPRTETRTTRLQLAGQPPRGRVFARGRTTEWRRENLLRFPSLRPAPQQIVCPECDAINRVPETALRLAQLDHKARLRERVLEYARTHSEKQTLRYFGITRSTLDFWKKLTPQSDMK